MNIQNFIASYLVRQSPSLLVDHLVAILFNHTIVVLPQWCRTLLKRSSAIAEWARAVDDMQLTHKTRRRYFDVIIFPRSFYPEMASFWHFVINFLDFVSSPNELCVKWGDARWRHLTNTFGRSLRWRRCVCRYHYYSSLSGTTQVYAPNVYGKMAYAYCTSYCTQQAFVSKCTLKLYAYGRNGRATGYDWISKCFWKATHQLHYMDGKSTTLRLRDRRWSRECYLCVLRRRSTSPPPSRLSPFRRSLACDCLRLIINL